MNSSCRRSGASEARTLALATALAVLTSIVTTLLLRPPPATESPAPGRRETSVPEAPAPAPAVIERADPGRDIEGEVPDARDARKLYEFEIPDDAVAMEVTVESPDGDVDVAATFRGTPPERDSDWDWHEHAEDSKAKLSLVRHADSDFRPGRLIVAAKAWSGAGHHGADHALAFTLSTRLVRAAAPQPIEPGSGVDATTDPDAGHRRDFVIDVPKDAQTLRIDLVEADRDLDLLASSKGQPFDFDTSQWSARSALGRESLVIDVDSDPKLAAGQKLRFAVVDPSVYDAPVNFRVVVTLGTDPPAQALAFPDLPIPSDPRELAVAAVVEIVVGGGTGSGTIVSEEGLVLTARHVVGEFEGDGDDPITIALDLDPTRMTRELFHAKVVFADESIDAAVLQITTGIYGQRLPKGYRFPACPVAFDALPRLGDPLVTIGFPEPAGTGTRSPVMFSKGVVSGFEREKAGLRMKTDAFVASGSSGGAALDERWRLVGVPVFTIAETGGNAQTGFLVPVTELPRTWRERLAAK